MATVFDRQLAAYADTPARRPADWAGFIVHSLMGAWLVWGSWLPLARESVLAAVFVAPVWAGTFLVAIGFLQRRPLLVGDRSYLGRGAAYFVTFAVPLFLTLLGDRLPPVATGARFVIAILLSIAASVFALWCTWTLRRAMSVEPQARVLITTGPYKLARHPLYAAYLMGVISLVLLRSNGLLITFLAVWFLCLLYRIRREEHVLAACFPEYVHLKARVGMFSPRLFSTRAWSGEAQ